MSDRSITPIDPVDLSAVAEIEALSFSAPWSEESLALLTTPQGGGFVAKVDESVAGYIGFLRVVDELEITNVATHPDYRRQSVGRALVTTLLEYGKANGFCRVTLEVRASNQAAISLYQSLGFSPCGIRKNFYSNPREDGIIYEIIF